MKQFLYNTAQRTGQLHGIARAIRIVTYISLFAAGGLSCFLGAIGALFGGAVSSAIMIAIESASGQPVMADGGVANLFALITYIMLLLPFMTTLALHLSMLGFARLLDAAADHVTWIEMNASVQFEDRPSKSYSMWE